MKSEKDFLQGDLSFKQMLNIHTRQKADLYMILT